MKKTSSVKLMVTMLTFVMVLLSCLTLSAQRAGFSGNWKLNESKSELGEFAARVAHTIKSEQKDESIAVTKTTPGFNGGDDITSTVNLTFDGKVVESEGFGGSKRKSTAKWSEDGKTLTINTTTNFERDGQSFEFKSTEKWTITADGLLSIDTNSTSPRGDSSTKAVYNK